MWMTQEEFDREKCYQVVTHFIKKMLREGLISEEEYRQIDTNNRHEMRPKTGDLFSGNSLIEEECRANMTHGKEALSYEENYKT